MRFSARFLLVQLDSSDKMKNISFHIIKQHVKGYRIAHRNNNKSRTHNFSHYFHEGSRVCKTYYSITDNKLSSSQSRVTHCDYRIR